MFSASIQKNVAMQYYDVFLITCTKTFKIDKDGTINSSVNIKHKNFIRNRMMVLKNLNGINLDIFLQQRLAMFFFYKGHIRKPIKIFFNFYFRVNAIAIFRFFEFILWFYFNKDWFKCDGLFCFQ